MIDFELELQDRLSVIRSVAQQNHLEQLAYISFSGGKDSTCLHYLIDMALPNNKIPRIYCDTGIEYQFNRDFVKSMAEKDNRFIIIKPNIPIIKLLKDKGYPFKSKFHSKMVRMFNMGYGGKTLTDYINGKFVNVAGSYFKLDSNFKYQFQQRSQYNYSDLCCKYLKKLPFSEWAKKNNRSIYITGMRAEEGGTRKHLGCILTDKNNNMVAFHPLIKLDNDFIDMFVKTFNIELSRLYYPPYNFKRTGCKGCPFNPLLKEELGNLKKYLPVEAKQCEIIWEPVYTEYRRIGFRL